MSAEITDDMEVYTNELDGSEEETNENLQDLRWRINERFLHGNVFAIFTQQLDRDYEHY